VLGSLGHND
jgi:hypothetical protein